MDLNANLSGAVPVKNVDSKYDISNKEADTPLFDLNESEDMDAIEKSADVIIESVEETSEKADDDIVEVVDAPYYRKEPYQYREKPAREITYGTTQVANMLGITAQTVRNYLNEYNQFLNVPIISTGSNSRAQFSKEDVENLRELIKVKDENNFTTEQMKEYLSNPNNIGHVPETRKFDRAMETFMKAFTETVQKYNQENQLLIEERESAHKAGLDSLKELVTQQNEQISSLKDALEQQKESINAMKEAASLKNEETLKEVTDQNKKKDALIDELSASKSQLEGQIKESMAQNSDKDKEIEQLQLKCKELSEQLAQKEKKRFRLFK